jgi:two-component system response regulator GlrR
MNAGRRSRPARILIVDDDPGLRRLLTIRLKAEKYIVEAAASAAAALEATTRFRPDLVVTDLRMAEMDGIALLRELQRRWPGLSVIMVTAHGTIPDAVRATQSGALAFLTKPVEKDRLLEEVRRALRASGFSDTTNESQFEFVTRSPVLEDRIAKARLLAATETPVVVVGEPGTGKELLVRAIHRASRRSEGPFVAVDCASLDEHQGVQRLHEAISQAQGGSLLLRGVDELDLRLQHVISRVFESDVTAQEPRAIASPAQFRLLATTERRLEEVAAEGRFTRELLDRLSGAYLDLPPLAKRLEDLPLLVARFLDELAAESDQARKSFSPEAMELLSSARWPGNVRELRQVVRELASLATGPVVSDELVRQVTRHAMRMPSFDEARDEFTRNYLVQLLTVTRGNVSQAARLARRNRTDLYKLLTRHEVSPDEFKE